MTRFFTAPPRGPPCADFRGHHSTETGLLKVTNDILQALDRGDVSLLTLLDLSAAFDTIDHSLLINTLHDHYRITGAALTWFESYLNSRTQSVFIGDFSSNAEPLSFGVPQGSVLGPVLFIMYTKPLHALIEQHSISDQSFADDTQLYNSSRPSEIEHALQDMQRCTTQVKSWMNQHKLKLNDDKTEALLIHTERSFSDCPKPASLQVGNYDIEFSSSARNLGFIISDNMSFEKYSSFVCKSAYVALRQISSIRHYLTITATKTLICSLVLSRLDYGNALLAGCPKILIDKLQRVRNSAAKLVFKAKKRDHVSPLLQSLHWLPIEARIKYKLSMICHKFFSGSSPVYISNLLSVYTPARSLRSSTDHFTLCVPKINRKSFGERAFAFSAPTQWNSLPKSLREIQSESSFKRALKTHLFQLYYPN